MRASRLAPIALLVLAAACASGGSSSTGSAQQAGAPRRGHGRNDPNCPSQIDSTYLLRGIVYRGCDVDNPAHAVQVAVRPDYQAARGESCLNAEFEFVVGRDGTPEVETARLVRTNNSRYAESLKRLLPTLRYTPAKKDGEPVRQVVRWSYAMVAVVTSSRSGGSPPITPRAARC